MESINELEGFRLLLLSLVIGVWGYWLWSRWNWYKFSWRFPGDFGLPIIGSFLKIKRVSNLLTTYGEIFAKCKKFTICVWLGLYPWVVTSDPEIVEHMLTSPELLTKAKSFYGVFYQELKGGLLASPVEKWKHNRKMINPSFSHKVLMSFFPIFNKFKNSTVETFESMVDNKEHKLADLLKRITAGISNETTMGTDVVKGDTFGRLVQAFNLSLHTVAKKGVLSHLKLDAIFWFNRKFNNTRESCYKFVEGLVEHRIKEMHSGNENFMNPTKKEETNIGRKEEDADAAIICIKKIPNIFIDEAIQLYKEGKFSWSDVISESNTIVAAGSETVGNCMCSALIFLAMHPQIQERVFNEIVSVFPEQPFDVEIEHLERLPYLEMVINETLRLAPPIPLMGRHILRDTQFGEDLTIPKDVQIYVSIFHLHRRKDIWGSNADQFDPDHFLPENSAGRHPYSFLPFSKGPRNCIGWRYALFLLRVLLCGLIRNYKFTTDFKYEDLKFEFNIALGYADEPLLKIIDRK